MLSREWFSLAQIAAMALPGLPETVRGMGEMAERGDWRRADWKDQRWRDRQGRGGGLEYHYSLLPQVAQIKLSIDLTKVDQARERETAKRETSREDMWRWFERLPDAKKKDSERRLDVLDTVAALVASGVKKTFAVTMVVTKFKALYAAEKFRVTLTTYYNWEKITRGIDRSDWLPWLAPRHVGRVETVECDPAAWEMLKSNYLRLEKPTFQRCFRDLQKAAKAHGWTIPSERTLQRRIDALPETVTVFAREGTEAVKRLFPAQRRDYSGLHALQAVNADGHKWDVFVKWPDGVVRRPMMLGFQDLYSGMILSWRIDWSENKETIRLAFGDLVGKYGIPSECYLDNGRGFASKWISGGMANRYRFKIKEDEPDGIMKSLGVKVHWVLPYHGQSKRIERAWRDMAGGVAKHPRFAGAYVGNNPTAKPENYGSKAVPLDVFMATVNEEIAEHNTRVGRKTLTCAGRSFQETFDASYVHAQIKKAAPEQQRFWLLAAEGITAAKLNGEIALEGNRYWASFLTEYRSVKVVVRFDPQNLHQAVHVYRLDGAYLGAAACIENTGFADRDAAKDTARKMAAWVKGERMQLEAERSMTPAQVAEMLPEPAPMAPPPEPRVIRMVTGATVRQAIEDIDEDDEDPRESAVMRALAQVTAGRRGGGHLSVVRNGDDD